MSSGAPVGGMRAMTRDAVRQRLSDVAINLFAERGFDEVTVEQVAVAAGISARSVHRYFPRKEDLVVGPLAAYGADVRDALLARPAAEPVVEALHAAYASMLRQRPQTRQDRLAVQLLGTAPALQARDLEKHQAWAELLEPLVARRLEGPDAVLRSRVLVRASLGAFSVALAAWADADEARDLQELLSAAFSAFRRTG